MDLIISGVAFKIEKSDDLDWSGLKLNRPFKMVEGGLKLYDHLILKSSETNLSNF